MKNLKTEESESIQKDYLTKKENYIIRKYSKLNSEDFKDIENLMRMVKPKNSERFIINFTKLRKRQKEFKIKILLANLRISNSKKRKGKINKNSCSVEISKLAQ